MWKYRSSAIFVAAMAFAVKTGVHNDVISLMATVLFLACHYADRFLSAERVEVKLTESMKAHSAEVTAKIKAYEDEIKAIKNDISRIGLTMGIRGNK